MNSAFCSSVPSSWITGSAMSDCTRNAMLMLPLSELLMASTYAAVAHKSCRLPPQRGSIRMPNMPSAPALANSSRGKMPSSSHSAA